MNGASFRRQTPIGPYVVDFVCHAASLVIELDGGQHFESEHERRDAWRDEFLARKGFRVLRFNNHEVLTNREGVSGDNCCSPRACPLPVPPPQAGEGTLWRRTLHSIAARWRAMSGAVSGAASGGAAAPARQWPAEGLTRVPYWVYSDRALADAEQERIFAGPTWNFLCLEAELPGPGATGARASAPCRWW